MSDIKRAFVSRFGKEGVLLNLDFSQLEVIGAATLSMDENLIADIEAGRDMHRHFASQLFNVPEEEVTKAQRDITKRFTFALNYGSGAKGLAAKNGTSVDVAQAFIDNYYGRYKGLKAWQDATIRAVERSRRPSGITLPSGQPRGVGRYQSPTGRWYVFFEEDPPAHFQRKEPSFQPTQMKNYGIQGFATGDVMALFRANVYRRWIEHEDRHRVLPINTVHDSVMFDVANEQLAISFAAELEEEAADLPMHLLQRWGIDSPLPFKVECEVGPNWQDMTKISKETA